MNAPTRYATATGIYDHRDFDGPPPMPFDEVVDRKEYDQLRAINEKLMYVLGCVCDQYENVRVAEGYTVNSSFRVREARQLLDSLTNPTKTP